MGRDAASRFFETLADDLSPEDLRKSIAKQQVQRQERIVRKRKFTTREKNKDISDQLQLLRKTIGEDAFRAFLIKNGITPDD